MVRKFNSQLGFEYLERRSMLSATVFEHNEIGYFLRGNQIERYDIEQEQWLSPVVLAGAPSSGSVGLVDDEGIYVAYGSAVYRYNSDGTGQTHLINAPSSVSAIHSDGSLLFLNHSSGLYAQFISINKITNTVIDTFENYVDSVYGSSISVQANRIFGRTGGVSPADITYVAYGDNGYFTGGGDSPYHGDYGGGAPTWVFPGGAKVTDTSGNVYSTDSLTRLNSFGSSILDIDFLGDEVPIVLSGTNTVSAYTVGLLPTGSASLSQSATEIFVNNQNVLAFAADGTNPQGYRVEILPLDALGAPMPGEPLNPIGLVYTPNSVEIAADGRLLLFSKAHQSIFTWDPILQTYGQTIPLVGVPEFMSYSAANNAVYLAYASGLIRQIDLDSDSLNEVPFANLPSRPLGLSTAGPYVFAVDGSGAWVSHYTFAPDGNQISARDWNYYSTEYVWSAANQKMYFFRDDTSPNDLLSEVINADGTIGNYLDSPLHTSAGFVHPIRVAPDGSVVVLGSGMIHNATTLARLTTSLANSVSDIAWLGSNLYTVRSAAGTAQYQEWTGASYSLGTVTQVSGAPNRLLAIGSDRLLGINIGAGGVPTFQVMDGNLQAIPRPTPVAIAGPDVDVVLNESVTLNGSNSFDPDASPNPITYQWSVVSGPGEWTFGSPTEAVTSFTPGAHGDYEVRLTVSDGIYSSSDMLIVSVRTNDAPVADASLSSTTAVAMRAGATLNATRSSDIDGDLLTYQWQILSSPDGGNPIIGMPNQAIASFTTDRAGVYTIELSVSDGRLSDTDTVVITVSTNQAPTADATRSETAGVAGRKYARLDGTLSSDPDADAITYSWTIISSPEESSASISLANKSIASLVADTPGLYTVELTVSDGLASDTDTLIVTVGLNQAPIASTSLTETSVLAGGPAAKLDGRNSYDPDGDVLTFAWKVIASSNEFFPTVSNATKSTALLSASTAGVYLIELKVSDGLAADTEFVIVTVRGNQPPVADASLSDRVAIEGRYVTLDGSRSFDADGDPLAFTWMIVASTNGTTPTILAPNEATTSFLAIADGSYAVELSVSDGAASDREYFLVSVLDNPVVGMAGDYNSDGAIDEMDGQMWRHGFGSATDLRADGNSDGNVDAADYVLWRKAGGPKSNAAPIDSPRGDYDSNGQLNDDDYAAWSASFGESGGSADGDGHGHVDAADYVLWRKLSSAAAGAAEGSAMAAISVTTDASEVLHGDEIEPVQEPSALSLTDESRSAFALWQPLDSPTAIMSQRSASSAMIEGRSGRVDSTALLLELSNFKRRREFFAFDDEGGRIDDEKTAAVIDALYDELGGPDVERHLIELL